MAFDQGPIAAENRFGPPGRAWGDRLRGHARSMMARAVRLGAPPRWFGYRHVEEEDLCRHADAARARGCPLSRHETVHPETRAANPLPVNAAMLPDLPDDRGTWGHSMRDVPARTCLETVIATIPDATVVTYLDDRRRFFPAILSRRSTAINLREIRFRPGHADKLRQTRAAGLRPVRLAKATWIAEQVYDDPSHWLTAHLPKLMLLKARGELDSVVLPQELSRAMEESLRMMGLDPAGFTRIGRLQTLAVEALTVLSTDRFRPELLRPVRDTIAPPLPRARRRRRVYIGRARARRRRLLNEDAIWPLFRDAGFERVCLERMSFRRQVGLMRETRVLAAPHGAGLANMMFCGEGTDIVEIANLGFPDPNAYALASAMGHRYHLVPAEAVGDVRPRDQDLRVDPDLLRRALSTVEGLRPSPRGGD